MNIKVTPGEYTIDGLQVRVDERGQFQLRRGGSFSGSYYNSVEHLQRSLAAERAEAEEKAVRTAERKVALSRVTPGTWWNGHELVDLDVRGLHASDPYKVLVTFASGAKDTARRDNVFRRLTTDERTEFLAARDALRAASAHRDAIGVTTSVEPDANLVAHFDPENARFRVEYRGVTYAAEKASELRREIEIALTAEAYPFALDGDAIVETAAYLRRRSWIRRLFASQADGERYLEAGLNYEAAATDLEAVRNRLAFAF